MSSTSTDFRELRQALANAPCLSIRQPWAELILQRRKKVELRRWSTRHRGWTWLHTGKALDRAAIDAFDLSALVTGSFVGAFQLRDVVNLDVELWEAWRPVHLDAGPYQRDVFGWVIGEVVRLKQPIAASGSLGLYRAENSTSESLMREQFLGEG